MIQATVDALTSELRTLFPESKLTPTSDSQFFGHVLTIASEKESPHRLEQIVTFVGKRSKPQVMTIKVLACFSIPNGWFTRANGKLLKKTTRQLRGKGVVLNLMGNRAFVVIELEEASPTIFSVISASQRTTEIAVELIKQLRDNQN